MKKPIGMMCLVGGCLVVCGLVLSLIAFICGAQTHITYSNGEIVLNDTGFSIGFIGDDHDWNYGNYEAVDTGIEQVDAFQNIDIDINTLEIKVVEGNDYAIELDYKSPQKVTYEVRGNTLYVEQDDSIKRTNIDGSEGSVTVYVDEKTDLDNAVIFNGLGGAEINDMQIGKLKTSVGMGIVELNNVVVQELDIEGGMGDINSSDLVSYETYVSVGMGSVDLEGAFKGDVTIEGGMGSIILTTTEAYEMYNYKLEKGMGIITLNSNDMNVFKDVNEDNGAAYTIDIEGGMGEIAVYTGK